MSAGARTGHGCMKPARSTRPAELPQAELGVAHPGDITHGGGDACPLACGAWTRQRDVLMGRQHTMANAERNRPGWPALPVIYEIDTAVWLGDLSRAAAQLVTLADVTGSDWDAITPDGVNAVWLMGVWERSPAGLALANANQELQASFCEALPDLRPEDNVGSPYCVRRYVADDMFGGRDGLAAARAALAARGVRLILDYVPNHVAPDHPWVMSDPELFVRGSEDDLRADPAGWVAAGGQVLAHGRDPYFPPWPDVVQLNAFAPAMRAATVETLADI